MRIKPLNLVPTQDKIAHTTEKSITRRGKNKRKDTNATAPRQTNAQANKMRVTLEDNMIVIRLPVFAAPTKSASGKSELYGSTRGPKKVMQEVDGKLQPVVFNGGNLKAIASAFVVSPAKKKVN
jgi:fatty acid-binding protein DegV